MAFPVKRIATGDERGEIVEVKVASMFRHDGVYVRPGDRIMMTQGEAADLKALHFVSDIRPGAAPFPGPTPSREYPGRGNGRGHIRKKP